MGKAAAAEAPEVKYPHLLPRFCESWLDAYDILKHDFERDPTIEFVEYVAGRNGAAYFENRRMTRDFLLARVGEELLRIRPESRFFAGILRGVLMEARGFSFSAQQQQQQVAEYLRELYFAAPRHT